MLFLKHVMQSGETRAQFYGSAYLKQRIGAYGSRVLTVSVFHVLAANLGFCACVLHVTRHSTLSRRNSALARKR